MARIETIHDRERDLAIRTVSGPVSATELVQAIRAFYENEAPRLLLWDFSDAVLDGISALEVQGLAQHAKPFASLRAKGRTAAVFATESGFGLGRMFEINQEIEGSPHAHRSFRDRESALRWLTSGAED